VRRESASYVEFLLVLAVGMVGLVSLTMNIRKTMFLASLQASMIVFGQLRSSMQ